MTSTTQYLTDPAQLAAFADVHDLRADWHEPDEQGIVARVVGSRLDNAFGPRSAPGMPLVDAEVDGVSELRVVLEHVVYEHQHECRVVVNLADLLSWATSTTAQVDKLMRYWLEQWQRIDRGVTSGDGSTGVVRADAVLYAAMLVADSLELGTATFVRRWLDAHGLPEFDDIGITRGGRATDVLHKLDERAK